MVSVLAKIHLISTFLYATDKLSTRSLIKALATNSFLANLKQSYSELYFI